MLPIKLIATTLDALHLAVLIYFASSLSWDRENERPSVVGFTAMIMTVMFNLVLIWFL